MPSGSRLSLLFLTVVTAFAQSDRGTITGTVSDPAGAVVAGAAIEARNTETGAVYPVAASNTGNYTIAEVPAGTYEVTVTVPGFKKLVRPNFDPAGGADHTCRCRSGGRQCFRVGYRQRGGSFAEDRERRV
jgi:hypothetical protein